MTTTEYRIVPGARFTDTWNIEKRQSWISPRRGVEVSLWSVEVSGFATVSKAADHLRALQLNDVGDRPSCDCGNPDAYWDGDLRREYACADCHGAA